MKTILHLLAAAAMLALLPTTRAAIVSRSTVTIRADGTAQTRTEYTMPRVQAEMQVRSRERYENMSVDDASDGDVTPPVTSQVQPAKPLTDDELAAKLREETEQSLEAGNQDSPVKIEDLKVDKDSVHVTTSRSFESVSALLAAGPGAWSENTFGFADVRFEKDAKGNLQVTLSQDPRMKRYARSSIQEIKLTGMSLELRLVLPGKVISSTFTNVQDNATWISVDPKDPASLDQVTKMYDAPVVVTAELNGLKLDQPLDARELARATVRADRDTSGLPITDAGPGFTAEASSVSTSTTYYFPEGKKQADLGGVYGPQPGTVVQAKLFAPKGRQMKSVSDVQIITAVDDKGRSVTRTNDLGDDEGMTTFSSESGDSRAPTSARISLDLALPAPNAQSIQEVTGQAVAITVGGWKEMTVTNTQGEIDLSDVLPGAKMTVTKSSFKNRQFSAQIELKGPATIRQLEVTAHMPSDERFGSGMNNSSANERSFKTANGQSTRSLRLQAYAINFNDEPVNTNQPPLVIRFPQDVKRERVKFKLSGLDLF
jgi:hypothetical protein